MPVPIAINMNRFYFSSVFDLAFRPFFILGSLFSIVALLVWGGVLANMVEFKAYFPVQLWHGHEMVYGFVAAIMVGFLLTAVQNWTGLRSSHGLSLMILALLWLTGRLLMWPGFDISWWLRMIGDISFLLFSAALLGRLLLKKAQKRNYFAVIGLLILSIDNVIFHYSIHLDNMASASQSLQSVILLITMMMSIIGGRVIPMFTANTTQTPPRPRKKWVDNGGVGLLWLITVIYLLQLQTSIPAYVLIMLFTLAGLLTALRCSQWRLMCAWRHPLLWSLHLGYWCISVGLILFALHYAGFISISLGLHSLTVGAMAGLILSMMSRVSLGHTGRKIMSTPLITSGLVMIFFAAFLRVILAPVLTEYTLIFWWLSIVFWTGAFSFFLYYYLPILTSPRADIQR